MRLRNESQKDQKNKAGAYSVSQKQIRKIANNKKTWDKIKERKYNLDIPLKLMMVKKSTR